MAINLPIANMPPEGFVVAGQANKIAIMMPPTKPITREQALNLAAWLVALADPVGEEFEKYLEAIRKGGKDD